MNHEIPPNAQAALRAAVNALSPVPSEEPIHITPVRLCDHCQDKAKEAFPYHVCDKTGHYWNDLCNECYDALGCSYDESYPVCPDCSAPMDWVDCWNGCEDGYLSLYEEDPLWYDEDDVEVCSVCEGKSGFWICPNAQAHDKQEKIEREEQL